MYIVEKSFFSETLSKFNIQTIGTKKLRYLVCSCNRQEYIQYSSLVKIWNSNVFDPKGATFEFKIKFLIHASNSYPLQMEIVNWIWKIWIEFCR